MSHGQRQQSGPPVTSVPALSSHQARAVTNKVNRLLTLSRVCSVELDFSYNRVSHGHEQVPGPPHTGGIHLTCRSNKIPCADTVGSPNSLPLRTPIYSVSYQQVKQGGVTLDDTHKVVRQRHQRNELKRKILVSPR